MDSYLTSENNKEKINIICFTWRGVFEELDSMPKIALRFDKASTSPITFYITLNYDTE